jgi:N-acetylglucosaminyl-diphospho-decaprenol L-rhamnosyltransferase
LSFDAGAAPDLTVIIIGHQVKDEVLVCLAALEAHSDGLTLQVVYVDNGSTDGSADAAEQAHPGLELVRLPENEGLPARNHGLRRARGRNRMFIDTDAVVTEGALQTMCSVLDEDPGIGLVGPRLVYPDGSLQLSARRYPPVMLPVLRRPPLARFFSDAPIVRRHLMADESPLRRRRVEYVLGACQMFSARAQEAAGEIDRRMWFGPDDADWCFSIRRAGLGVLYAPEATVIHDYRRTSAASPLSRMALEHLRGFAYFQWKWRGERRELIAEGRAMDLQAA